MINRILMLCDYAAYYRIDTGFLLVALLGSALIALGKPHGWLIAIANLALFACAAAFGDGSMRPAYNSQKRIARDLARRFTPQSVEGEPLPPWIKEPGADPLHIVWRMGGERYIADFYGFFRDLKGSEREAYFARYDLGTRWPHRRKWHQALFDSTDVVDDQTATTPWNFN